MTIFTAASTEPAPRHLTGVKEWYRLGLLLPWLVLAVSLAATYLMWKSEQQNAIKDLQIDFDFRVREADSLITKRMIAYEQILRGVRSLFTANQNEVSHSKFHEYIDSLDLEDNYPGAKALGFLMLVPSSKKEQHVASLRKEAFAQYNIVPSGEREIYAPATYVEPHTGNNLQTQGMDAYSDPVLHAAMERARDTDQAVNSGKLLLPLQADEDKRVQGGFLMYLPVYKTGAAHVTVAERRANIIGWVYASFRMVDLMTGILGEIASEIDIEIHDGEDVSDETMMYDPDISGMGGNPQAQFKSRSRIEVANRNWTVVIRSLYGFETRLDRQKPKLVAYAGVGASVLLALLTCLLVRGRARAMQAAEEINRELAERKRAEEGLRLAATVLHTVEEAVVVTDPNNNIITVNPAFTAITGYSASEVIGKNPRILSSGKHPPEFYKEMWTSLLSTGSWHGEIWDRRKSGELYVKWLSIKAVRDEKGKLTHYMAVFSDISERKAAEEHMQHLAHHDALTGLPNRALFTDRLQQSLVKAKRDKAHMALMFLDLDKFKPVNDTFGHAVGDLLLKEVAKRLQHCVRESDTAARLGGDEFVVLLPSIEAQQDAMLVADKILHALSQPFELADHSLHISSSIGVAVYPEHGDDERLLVKSADIAMYHAKGSGRNNAQFYQPGMQELSQ